MCCFAARKTLEAAGNNNEMSINKNKRQETISKKTSFSRAANHSRLKVGLSKSVFAIFLRMRREGDWRDF